MQEIELEWSIEALNDFEDYIDWYLKNTNEKIAEEFTLNIEKALEIIKENNYISRMVDKIPELREYIAQKFPYIISYWIKSSNKIIITSFVHQKLKK